MSLFEKELLKRLNTYKKQGLIDDKSKANLRAYLEKKSNNGAQAFKNSLYIIGIILIFMGAGLAVYHNWANLNERLQEFLAFVPLAISAILGVYAFKLNLNQFWKESAALLNVAGVAVMIATIQRIYQLQPDTAHYCLSVMVLTALAIPLFKSSTTVVALSLFNFTFIWNSPTTEFIVGIVIYALLLLAAYKFSKRGGVFRNLALLVVAIMFAISISEKVTQTTLGNVIFAGFVGIYLCIASTKKYADASIFNNVFAVAGGLGIFWYACIGGSSYMIEAILKDSLPSAINEIAFTPTLVTIAAFYIFTLFFALRNPRRTNALIVLSAIFPIMASIILFRSFWAATFLINGIIFVGGIMIFLRGIKLKSTAFFNLGIVTILFLCVCRIFDSQTDVVIRASAFAIAGVILVISNFILNRRNSHAR